MASQVDICNMAVSKVGSDAFITSIDDGTKSARYLKNVYEIARDALLRSHLWKFARKRAILAPLVSQPEFDGGYYFQLPVDCLRVIGTDLDSQGQYLRWHVEGDKIISDTDTLKIVYIARITNEELFDPLFVDAFSAKLAYEISMPLTQSINIKQLMGQEMRSAILRAAHAGSTEQDSMAFLSEVFIKAHN